MANRPAGVLLAWLALIGGPTVGWSDDRPKASVVVPRCTCRQQDGWTVTESPNFQVWSRLPRPEALAVNQQCEVLRTQLRRCWAPQLDESPWRPPCIVVIHAADAPYRQAIGAREDASVACTTVTVDHGEIVFRRIDLRGDVTGWNINALPHELTHVVVSDVVTDRPLPQWLHEGIAMTSESSGLQQQRLNLLRSAAREQRLPPIEDLFAPHRRASRANTDLHYAASFALVLHLRQWGDDEQLLRFARQYRDSGGAAALAEVYGVRGGLRELETRWTAGISGLRETPLPEVALVHHQAE
jgi:hypothetical protein